MTFKSFQFIVSILKYHKTKTLRSVFWVGSRRPKNRKCQFFENKEKLIFLFAIKVSVSYRFFFNEKKISKWLILKLPFFLKIFFYTKRDIQYRFFGILLPTRFSTLSIRSFKILPKFTFDGIFKVIQRTWKLSCRSFTVIKITFWYPFIALSQRYGPSKTRGWENNGVFKNDSAD